MVTYPGLPAPEVEVIVDHDTSRARYQNKSEFLIASLHLCGNTGTYVDSPLHRHRGATDLAGLSLERVAHVLGLIRPAIRKHLLQHGELRIERICALFSHGCFLSLL